MKHFKFTTFIYCIVIVCSLSLVSNQLSAQSTISGQVKDDKSNLLPFASVYIENSIDGATTDSLGRFSFKTMEKGKKILIASFVGYVTRQDSILIDKKLIVHNMIIKRNAVAINEVIVTAGAFQVNDDQKVAVLKPLDIYTNAGAGGDIMGAIRSLPGTQAQSDQTGLFVRGGDASETSVVIDEMVVQNPFSSNVPGVSQRSRFTPFQFKGISFSSGGYGARYGQALSSVLELNTTDLPENSNANISIGMTGVQASATKKLNASAFEFTGHYDNLYPFLSFANSNLKFYNAPTGGGFSIKYTLLKTKTNVLKIFVKYEGASSGTNVPNPFVSDSTNIFGSNNNISENKSATDSIIPFGLKNNNTYFNSSYSHLFGKLLVWTAVSASGNNDRLHWDSIPAANNDWRLECRGEALYHFNLKFSLLTGVELQKYQYKQSFSAFHSQFTEMLTAGYLDGEWKPSRWLAIKPGFRFEHSELLHTNNVAPRFAMAIGTGAYSQISLAGGQYFEDPDKNYLLAGYRPNFQEATHYIANFQWIKDDRTFRVEGYYKTYSQMVRERLSDTVRFNPNPYRPLFNEVVDNSGSGYARGIEIFWRDKKSIPDFDYWISYSYIDTKRLYENYKEKTTPPFVSKHNLTVLVKYFIEPLQVNIGASYTYASGRPYYNPNSPVFLSDKTPDIHNIAINASYLLTVGRYFGVAYISIDNITHRKNIYGYNYSFDGQHRYPIVPALYTWIYAGFTISLTKFKKEEL